VEYSERNVAQARITLGYAAAILSKRGDRRTPRAAMVVVCIIRGFGGGSAIDHRTSVRLAPARRAVLKASRFAGIRAAPALRRHRSRSTSAGVRTVARGMLRPMTIEQLVSAIRSLPVPERLRVIERAARDVATDVSPGPLEALEAAPGTGVTLIERHGFLIAHGEAGVALPEEAFDHRVDREARAEHLWGGS
jgi:hypothetical protein